MKVQIVDVPPGEAPDWVRKQWVGLELQLAQRAQSEVSPLTAGVLSGPKNVWVGIIGAVLGRYRRQSGFRVSVLEALRVLEGASPEAANWWRINTPHLCKPKRYFIFQARVCKVVAE